MSVIYGLVDLVTATAVPVKVDTLGRLVVSDAPQASIVDTTGATYHYICEAPPGSSADDPVWRVCRLELATGVLQWAGGSADYASIAANRATLSYS